MLKWVDVWVYIRTCDGDVWFDPTCAGHFSVGATSGELTVAFALDREQQDSYILNVTATDQGEGNNQARVRSVCKLLFCIWGINVTITEREFVQLWFASQKVIQSIM